MNKKIILLFIGVIIVVAGLSFYGGYFYGRQKNNSATWQGTVGQNRPNLGTNGSRFNNQTSRAGQFINGEIISLDDKSITVKMRDGGSKIIFLSSSTIVNKMAEGTVADLLVGKEVIVNGSANTDGSVSAQNIQIRPAAPAVGASNQTQPQ